MISEQEKTKNLRSTIQELLDIKDELYQLGLITPFGGNISVRTPEDPQKILITPGGIYKKNLTPEQILCVDLDGNILHETTYKSTSETPIHLSILRHRADIKAVVHTHAPYATVVGLTDMEFLPITSDAVIVGGLPVVEWTVTGSEESGRVLSEAFGDKGMFVLIRNHGLFVGGPNLQFACGVTRMIEDTCKELVLCKMTGISPRLLPQEKIDIIHQLSKRGSV